MKTIAGGATGRECGRAGARVRAQAQAPLLALASGPGPLALPEGGWFYYALSAAVFVFAGIVCGFFIWRKGAMQAEDAEMEVKRSSAEIAKVREELEREERVLAEGTEAREGTDPRGGGSGSGE